MMKNALIVVIIFAISIVAGLFLLFRNEDAVSTSAARPWPGRMGTLETVAKKWPQLKANDASVKLTALNKSLAKDSVVVDFVEREIARNDLTIGDPPGTADVSEIRELLLRELI